MGKKVKKVKEVKSAVKEIKAVFIRKEGNDAEENEIEGDIEFVDNVSSSSSSAGAPSLEVQTRDVDVPQNQQTSQVSGSREESAEQNERAFYEARYDLRGEAAFRSGYAMGGSGKGERKEYKTSEEVVGSSSSNLLRQRDVGRDFAMQQQKSTLPEGRATQVGERMSQERKEMEQGRGRKYKWQEFE